MHCGRLEIGLDRPIRHCRPGRPCGEKALDDDRRDELLDGVMAIIAERGFSQVTIAEMARELQCSAATLYKIAPSKDSLVLLAIARWADVTFADMERRALRKGKTASERARAVLPGRGAERTAPAVADVLRGDIGRFESTRLAWWTSRRRTATSIASSSLLDDAARRARSGP